MELSRGFQSYVWRKSCKNEFPIFYVLHISMNIKQLDLFLEDVEKTFNVKCHKAIGINGNKIFIKIIKENVK